LRIGRLDLARRARPAGADLTAFSAGGDADANAESLGILVFTGVRLVAVGGVQEETSAPHVRLAYIHLQTSSPKISAHQKQSNSTAPTIKEKRQKKARARHRRALRAANAT
jgi:predicted dinucleotide-binding enzyme